MSQSSDNNLKSDEAFRAPEMMSSCNEIQPIKIHHRGVEALTRSSNKSPIGQDGRMAAYCRNCGSTEFPN